MADDPLGCCESDWRVYAVPLDGRACCADGHASWTARGHDRGWAWYHTAGLLAATQGHTRACPFGQNEDDRWGVGQGPRRLAACGLAALA